MLDDCPDHDGRSKSGSTSTDLDADLADLLCHCLDGGDPLRTERLLRLIHMRQDRDRADVIDRMREAGIPDVFRL